MHAQVPSVRPFWVLFVVRFPTLLLVGSGLIPAGIVWYVVARPMSRANG
jgi:hypothetical protein